MRAGQYGARVDARLPYPPGARRVDRPAAAKPCATCGELLGRGYPDCSSCANSVDRLWLADWTELRGAADERELAERVLDAEVGEYPWTCADWALRLLRCAGCRAELGAGALECVGCAAADSARWEWDDAAMTPNERALRAAVASLRTPHRSRGVIVATWRLVVPFLLVGELVTVPELRRLRTQVLAGRHAELAALDSLAELTEAPLLPWRRPLG